jgi:hypothetical protein
MSRFAESLYRMTLCCIDRAHGAEYDKRICMAGYGVMLYKTVVNCMRCEASAAAMVQVMVL